jgi:HD superfamily phosphohydrolase
VERLNVELGGACKLSHDDVIISYVSFEPYTEDLYITTATRPIPISEISPLVQAINEAWRRAPHVFLFIRRKTLDKCGEATLRGLKDALEPLLDLAIRRVSTQSHA